MAEVASPLGLGCIERGVQAHGDEGVLEGSPDARVCVHVPRRHTRHAQTIGDPPEPAVARPIVAQERPL